MTSSDVETLGLLIDGEQRPSRRSMEVRDPYHDRVVALVPNASSEEVGEAIASAERAFPAWSETPAWKRAEILGRAAGILEERADDLARTIVGELGKPIRDSRGEATRSPRILHRAGEEAKRFHGEIVQMDAYPGRSVVSASPCASRSGRSCRSRRSTAP